MANLSSFLTTSFHTKLTFMDADSEENLEEEEEEDDYDKDEDKVHRFSSSGILLLILFLMSGAKSWRRWSFDIYIYLFYKSHCISLLEMCMFLSVLLHITLL